MSNDYPILSHPRGGPPKIVSGAEDIHTIADLLNENPLAIDTERAVGKYYSAHAELIQCRQNSIGTFLIDTQSCSEHFTPLYNIFARAQWIIHSAGQDLLSLQQLGFHCSQLFDTELAGRFLGYTHVNLAALTRELLGINLAKGLAREDWSIRPFSQEMLNYAALDVELLFELKNSLTNLLSLSSKLDWFDEECQYILQKTAYSIRKFSGKKIKGYAQLTSVEQKYLVQQLWQLREQFAYDNDIYFATIFDDAQLISWAQELPDQYLITALFAQYPPQFIENFLAIVHNFPHMTEIAPYTRHSSKNTPERREVIIKTINEVAQKHTIDPVILSSKIITNALCDYTATDSLTISECLQHAGARRWQMNLLSSALEDKLR